jgi:hypothetical protein
LRVERRVDGAFLDNTSTGEAVRLVDPGSVTAALVFAHHLDPGPFKALYFEDFQPAVVSWSYAVKANGVHSLQTGEGPLVALFRADGGLDKMERARGNGVLRQFAVETLTHGGAGVPLPPDRVAGGASVTAEDEPADSSKPGSPNSVTQEPDTPKADAPKADSPKADAPKADAPKTDAPKADAPKADAMEARASSEQAR